jgi:hypothetical protein
MSIAILLLCSAILYFFGVRQWLRNWRETKVLNQSEKRIYARGFNWFWNLIWPFYLLVFATGLWVNNLILA